MPGCGALVGAQQRSGTARQNRKDLDTQESDEIFTCAAKSRMIKSLNPNTGLTKAAPYAPKIGSVCRIKPTTLDFAPSAHAAKMAESSLIFLLAPVPLAAFRKREPLTRID